MILYTVGRDITFLFGPLHLEEATTKTRHHTIPSDPLKGKDTRQQMIRRRHGHVSFIGYAFILFN